MRVERLLSLACDQLGMDVAFLGELVDGHEVVRAVHGDGTRFGVHTGTELPFSERLCDGMLKGRTPNVVVDSSTEPEIAGLAHVREGGGLGAISACPCASPMAACTARWAR